jgi:aminoglycoside phosphotransferase (APT) family kinase protein
VSMSETVELRAALEEAISAHEGKPVAVTGLERRPCEYRTSFALEELEVTLADGRTLQLMFKNLSRTSLDEDALLVKPAFLHDPAREIEVYRDLLDAAGLGTPAYLGASVDPAADRHWLFIENVAGPVLWQVGEFDVWEEAARWLARMHAALAPAAKAPPQSLLHYGPDLYRTWIERARRFAERRSTPWSDETRATVMDLSTRYEPVVERLAALQPTIVHGEFYPSNVLVQHAQGSVRIAPIDWEIAGVGPGLLDLAALTIGKWTPAQRAALAHAYREAAAAGPAAGAIPADFDAALDLCRLHLAVQALGWEPEWQPPAEHRHDWLAESVRIAGELRL